jgi:hypothetical protein
MRKNDAVCLTGHQVPGPSVKNESSSVCRGFKVAFQRCLENALDQPIVPSNARRAIGKCRSHFLELAGNRRGDGVGVYLLAPPLRGKCIGTGPSFPNLRFLGGKNPRKIIAGETFPHKEKQNAGEMRTKGSNNPFDIID